MKRPLISIITPTFNTTELIFETFDALKKQTYKNFEWIFVDDGSTDNTLLQELEKDKILNIKIIYNKKNLGPSFCRNIGAQNAIGEYIMFLDDDDFYTDKLLEEMVKVINKDPERIVYAQTLKFYKRNNQFYYLNAIDHKEASFMGMKLIENALKGINMHHCSLLMPKKCFDTIGGYDERLFVDEDGNLLFKLFLENYTFTKVNNEFHMYRQHNVRDRLSFNESDDRIKNRILAMNILIDLFKRKKIFERYTYEIALRIDHIAHSTCINGRKKLTEEILQFAAHIDPLYLKKRQGLKGILRRNLGCNNYYKLMKIYTTLRKIFKIGA